MRIWLRRKRQQEEKQHAVHEFNGSDTTCFAVQLKGLNLQNYEVTGRVFANEHVCSACQTGIAVRRGKF